MKRHIFTFPDVIAFTDTPLYAETIGRYDAASRFVFDLRSTTDVHTSFIGVLITAKRKIEQSGGSISILCSPELSKILYYRELRTFFAERNKRPKPFASGRNRHLVNSEV